MQEFPPDKDNVRSAAVAGAFYPEKRERLEGLVSELLEHATVDLTESPKALIAPHAGYIYSGPIAASAFGVLPPTTRRVVVIGPSHHFNFSGLAVPDCTAFRTPLGDVRIDAAGMSRLATLPYVQSINQAHRHEHSIEVMLPFLQTVLDDFTLLPVVTGDATDEEMGAVLNLFWEEPETRFIISSDLSHYYTYEEAQQMDRKTARSIEQLRPQAIQPENACGRVPIRGLLWAATRHRLTVRTLDLRNSGDTAGPRDRVVGYGAFAFF